MNERIDTTSRLIHALPSEVYAAFATQQALETWLPPDEMEGQVAAFEFREGGGYRMRLTYTVAEHTVGKTSEHSDEVGVRFTKLVPNERIEQAVIFASEKEDFAGEMQMTWVFERRPNGTHVTISCTNVPEGILSEEHEAGLTSSLRNLAVFVEGTKLEE